MSRIHSQLLLVGSVPLRTPTEVFRMFGSRLGSYLSAIPDGEPGDRSMWVDFLAVRTYHEHPQIDTVATPTPTGEPDDWKSTTFANLWSFKVKPGVSELHFDRLLYAEDAINSYHAFHDLRERGLEIDQLGAYVDLDHEVVGRNVVEDPGNLPLERLFIRRVDQSPVAAVREVDQRRARGGR